MTGKDLLEKVKKSLGITGNYQDEVLESYIFEVLEYLSDAGVSEAVLQDEAIVGTVARGVSDLWNYGSGGVGFSQYFTQRVVQLAYKTEV